MIFDTDVLIWVQRRNPQAARLLDHSEERIVSILTYMELLQGAASAKEIRITKDFLKNYGFEILPLTENIGHRASIYIEEYAVHHGLRTGDAIIAATAMEHNLVLVTENKKHFHRISDLKAIWFHP